MSSVRNRRNDSVIWLAAGFGLSNQHERLPNSLGPFSTSMWPSAADDVSSHERPGPELSATRKGCIDCATSSRSVKKDTSTIISPCFTAVLHALLLFRFRASKVRVNYGFEFTLEKICNYTVGKLDRKTTTRITIRTSKT